MIGHHIMLLSSLVSGAWFEDFARQPDNIFILRNGERIEIPFMRKLSSCIGYGETKDLEVVTVPYKESGFYMMMAIPKSMDDNIGEPLILPIRTETVISYRR